MIMQRNLRWALLPLLLISSAALAQSDAPMDWSGHIRFRVLYNFTGGEDGAFLYGGLARDREGSLYGVTFVNGGAKGGGALFKLERERSGYYLKVLHDLVYHPAGDCMTTPVFDHEKNLFGVCTDGVSGGGAGSLWEYSHDGRFSILHVFNEATDGMRPVDAVAVDDSGNIYGTTYEDGPGFGGTLWEYSRFQHTFTVLHAFANKDDGNLLPAGPTLDANGKLWGTTQYGPNCWYCGAGTVWSYDLASGTFTTVADFGSTGAAAPQSRLALDLKGNFYGTGSGTTVGNCGLVFELEKNNNYAPVILYSFTGAIGQNGDGCSPLGSVALDEHGNVLGATCYGGDSDWGTVYMLSREHDKWEETILHSFNFKDGSCPAALTKGEGRWFGTATFGGTGEGVIFEISGAK
jgi:uncharacterized repeat protein (TIGR03803 family)